MKLSILIPSKRPKELENFLASLRENSTNFNDIEIVILRDGVGHMVYHEDNFIFIEHQPTKFITELLYECYANSTGDWIMFGNDDLVCETMGWDLILDGIIKQLGTNPYLFYINDDIFKSRFPCFPIVSRKLLEISNFFPLLPKFRKYKVDDTLAVIVPRMVYISQIVMKHLNIGEEGFAINGKIYSVDRECGEYDQILWEQTHSLRDEMRERIVQLWNQ